MKISPAPETKAMAWWMVSAPSQPIAEATAQEVLKELKKASR